MSLRIRRGTNAQRLTTTLDLGEIGYTTDTQKLYAGDGVSAGGRHVLASSAGNGLFFNETSQQLDLSVGALTLTTADITESSSLYFTQARAQAAVAAAFTAGQSLGNVTFSYDDTTAKIYANITPDGVGIMSVSEDTAPVLGGNLTLGGHDIVGSGNLTVVGALTATSYTGAILLTNDNISGTGNIDITGNIATSGSILVGTGISITSNTIINSQVAPVNGPLGIISSPVYIGNDNTPNTLAITSAEKIAVFTGLTNGVKTASLTFRVSRGSLLVPQSLQSGDYVAAVQGRAFDGASYLDIGGFGLIADQDTTVAQGSIAGAFGVVVVTKSGTTSTMLFNSAGVLSAPIMKTGQYTTTARNALTPTIGMMIYNTTTGMFEGYKNTGWASLG
jgi:hypothetical protein